MLTRVPEVERDSGLSSDDARRKRFESGRADDGCMDTTIRLLGQPTICHDGRATVLGGRCPQALLAALALDLGRPVRADTLMTAIWGPEPPPTARKALQGLVVRLRRAMPSRLIETAGSGYRLDLPPEALDVTCFTDLVDQATAARPAEAVPLFQRALGLWAGTPFGDLSTEHFTIERAWLDERRRSAEEDRCGALLALGRTAEAAVDLERLTRLEPLRERRWAMLMTALYRLGRQVHALRAYQRVRTLLVDEIGIEPGPELSDLETAILKRDPRLDHDHASTTAWTTV